MPERKTLNEDLFYKGSSANLPRLHTCENKVPFWDKSKPFASHYCILYYAYTIYTGHNPTIMTTSMNERTHFFIKIYLSHFIRKGWCWLCVRGKLETGTDCYILTQGSSDHRNTSFSSWLLNRGSLRAQALCLPLALNSASCPQLTPTATATELNKTDQPKPSVAPGYIIV